MRNAFSPRPEKIEHNPKPRGVQVADRQTELWRDLRMEVPREVANTVLTDLQDSLAR
jgi:hypothetical protein